MFFSSAKHRFITVWIGALLAASSFLLVSADAQASSYARHKKIGNADMREQARRSHQLWYRLSLQFELPASVSHPEVERWIKWYQKHSLHISRLQEAASPWIGFVLGEVEKRDLPAELALLPAVESAYDPLAYSHGRAAGLWQFIPSTATYLGLDRNWWFDARRDVPQSTQAALNYLEYLHRRFGNWLHALAAYNAGEGNVSGAIRRNKKRGLATDFWSLKLPKETQAYVPKLLALAEIIRDPNHYGIKLLNMPNGKRFEVVETGGQIDLAQAAKLADLNLDTLRRHNPGLNRWATPPEGPHRLLIPTYSADRFKRGLSNLASNQRVTWRRHQVKSGETLSEIAENYRTSSGLLREVNGLNGNTIRVGQKLLVASGQKSLSHYPSVVPTSSGGATKERRSYLVKDGESLWLIARRHNLHMTDIERWNNISRKRPLQPGQHLVLWMPRGSEAKPSGPTHTVVSGDNLWDLAKKYKLAISKLRQWNQLKPGQWLKPGQTLRLAPPTLSSGDGPTRKVSYSVRNGDSLDRIARKFGVTVAQLCDWNGINPKRYLRPGQRLRVLVPVHEQWSDA